LQGLLIERRNAFVEACEELKVPINPTHDGFFGWLEHDDPESIIEKCVADHVYFVPLRGGVRIGLCVIPLSSIHRVVQTLQKALN
jgi:hypothetical protein